MRAGKKKEDEAKPRGERGGMDREGKRKADIDCLSKLFFYQYRSIGS